MSRVVSTNKLAPDWLHKSEQPIRSQESKLTQLLTMKTIHKFPPQEQCQEAESPTAMTGSLSPRVRQFLQRDHTESQTATPTSDVSLSTCSDIEDLGVVDYSFESGSENVTQQHSPLYDNQAFNVEQPPLNREQLNNNPNCLVTNSFSDILTDSPLPSTSLQPLLWSMTTSPFPLNSPCAPAAARASPLDTGQPARASVTPLESAISSEGVLFSIQLPDRGEVTLCTRIVKDTYS